MNKKDKKFEVAEVVIDLPALELNRPFDYKVAPKLIKSIKIGQIVLVPFGHRKETGFIVGLKKKSDFPELLEIEEIIEEEPILDSSQLTIYSWLSEYYLSSFSEAIHLALPPGRSRKIEVMYRLEENYLSGKHKISSKQQEKILEYIKGKSGPVAKDEITRFFKSKFPASSLSQLEKKGIISKTHKLAQPSVSARDISFAKIKAGLVVQENIKKISSRASVQRRMFEYLLENKIVPVSKLVSSTNGNYSSLKSLKDKGLIEIFNQEIERKPDNYYLEEVEFPIRLTDEQKRALQKIMKSINSNQHKAFLLDGVTGSGKTEIYIRAASKVLEKERSVIILVPEISLTPQTFRRFQIRLNKPVALLHSSLSLGERYDQYRRVKDGQYKVILGTRSALFAPAKDLGLIIIDEEHEVSYKQNTSPRYNTRYVARHIARHLKIPLILGSATPSLESYYLADSGEYDYLQLTKRVNEKKLPQVEIIDMRQEYKSGGYNIVSRKLLKEMEVRLEKQEKVILFLNRRGYSSFILCRDCGFIARCPNCKISLTFHRSFSELRCHHCDYGQSAPRNCPQCDSHNFKYSGSGTEQVELEIEKKFPGWPIIRMDRDTVAGRDRHRQKLVQFIESDSGILVGTQMIAKGLHIPQVTLVGVINADTALNFPDFRAAERTFQILMQVSGRAGRGEVPGKVIVQTYQPDNYSIKAVADSDYKKFYRQELSFRKELNYPPYSHLINITAGGLREDDVRQVIEGLTERLDQESMNYLGPSRAPLYRLRGTFRWHILIKSNEILKASIILRKILEGLLAGIKKKQVTLTVDIDPNWLL